MDFRSCNKNGPALSAIGIGSWAIGGNWKYGWGEQNDSDSIAAIETLFDLGANWIDTSPVYGLGHAETLIGKLQIRKKLFIATKGGLIWDSQGNVEKNLEPQSIRRECEQSLKRLNVETIDLYQLHWPDPKRPYQAAWQEILKMRDEGKIRFCGLSNFWIHDIKSCLEFSGSGAEGLWSLQAPLSLLDRSFELNVLPFCSSSQVGFLGYSPLQNGLLTGNFSREKLNSLPENDWRKKHKYFRSPFFERVLANIEKMKSVADELQLTPGQLATAWALHRPGVTSVLLGARNAEQARAAYSSRMNEVPQSVFGKLEKFFEKSR
ncbi:MAG: aldo/keto reductase [Leptospiraceae bacterium]|nr:aldo/keto reductase [Leptospiraceae bacterium]